MAKRKSNAGRPTVMTRETLDKLEEVFSIGGTDSEACFYANISVDALYKYQKENPEYIQRKEGLKEQPILKARRTIVNGLSSPTNAAWYLERKKKGEFSTRQELDIQGEMKISKLEEIQKQTQSILNKKK